MADFKQLNAVLSEQLRQNHITITDVATRQLTTYILLLHQWNQTYNLTSIRNPIVMLSKHILDSLSIIPYLQGTHILDVGTGAGLPGIPLAITHPHYRFSLLDSNGKKTRFLTHVMQTLALSNVAIVQARAETFRVAYCFNTIISRAFGPLNDFLKKTRHLCCENGIFLVMKGQYPLEEINALETPFHVIAAESLSIVGLNEKRHILVIGFNN